MKLRPRIETINVDGVDYPTPWARLWFWVSRGDRRRWNWLVARAKEWR